MSDSESDSSRESSPHSCSSEESYRPEVLPGFSLSLQDLCLLYVLFQVNEFPVKRLVLLPHVPRVIRQRLFNGLPRADILHLGDTALFSDLDEFEKNVSTAREELLKVIFEGEPQRFICSNFYEGYHCLDYCVPEEIDALEFYSIICETQSFTSLEASLILLGGGNGIVVPKHLRQYIEKRDFTHNKHDLPPDQVKSLLHYCNMHFAPKELKIDCYAFTDTALWRNYIAEAANPSFPTTDPVIPVLQEFLTSVEELEVGRTLETRDYIYRKVGGARVIEASCKVPYVLLYNIVTNNQARLKHVKVFDIPTIAEWILEAVAGLLCTHESNLSQVPIATPKSAFSLSSMEPERTKLDMVIPLASPKPEPYKLESISILPHGKYQHQMYASPAQHIASVSQSIIAYQIQSLRSVTIQNIGFCISDADQAMVMGRPNEDVNVPAYMAILSLLSELLKQPQFEILTIDKTPFKAALELIVTFLTTPTDHEQTLSIEGKEEEEESGSKTNNEIEVNESRKRNDALQTSDIPPSKAMKHSSPVLSAHDQFFPETNAQYKCLDVGQSCYGLLSTFPELKLKKLTMRTQDMIYVPENMMIQVEHISFTPPAVISNKTPSISFAQLEKFVVSNLVLKRLEFSTPRTSPGIFPALNHCLSVLYQQGRGLDEIVLNSVQFNNCDHMKDFFIQVGNLSHDHGTTLVMSSLDRLLVRFCTNVREQQSGNKTLKFAQWSTQEDESRLFADLSNHFQEKKIKKIVFTAYKDNQGHLLLKQLTKDLVVHHV